MEQLTPIIEQQHRTIARITDANGTVTTLPLAIETIFLTPENGARVFTSEEYLYRFGDGRLAKPSETLQCTTCQVVVAVAAGSYCRDCQAALCKPCATTPPLCRSCRRKDRIKRCIVWLTSL